MPRLIASRGESNWTGLTVEQDLAFVRQGQAVQDVHQRGLARAIFAEQSQHFARVQLQVDVVVGDQATETLDDPARFENWRGSAVGHTGCRPPLAA